MRREEGMAGLSPIGCICQLEDSIGCDGSRISQIHVISSSKSIEKEVSSKRAAMGGEEENKVWDCGW